MAAPCDTDELRCAKCGKTEDFFLCSNEKDTLMMSFCDINSTIVFKIARCFQRGIIHYGSPPRSRKKGGSVLAGLFPARIWPFSCSNLDFFLLKRALLTAPTVHTCMMHRWKAHRISNNLMCHMTQSDPAGGQRGRRGAGVLFCCRRPLAKNPTPADLNHSGTVG